MSQTFTEFVTLEKEVCGKCGGVYALADRFLAHARNYGNEWHCPYCQCQWRYTKPEVERLRDQLAETESALRAEKCNVLRERNEKERAIAAQMRLTKRIGKGVCPCCKRTVSQLANHMASKHPDFGK